MFKYTGRSFYQDVLQQSDRNCNYLSLKCFIEKKFEMVFRLVKDS